MRTQCPCSSSPSRRNYKVSPLQISTQQISVKLGLRFSAPLVIQVLFSAGQKFSLFPASSSGLWLLEGSLSLHHATQFRCCLGLCAMPFRRAEGSFRSPLGAAHKHLSILEPHTMAQPFQQSELRVNLSYQGCQHQIHSFTGKVLTPPRRQVVPLDPSAQHRLSFSHPTLRV